MIDMNIELQRTRCELAAEIKNISRAWRLSKRGRHPAQSDQYFLDRVLFDLPLAVKNYTRALTALGLSKAAIESIAYDARILLLKRSDSNEF